MFQKTAGKRLQNFNWNCFDSSYLILSQKLLLILRRSTLGPFDCVRISILIYYIHLSHRQIWPNKSIRLWMTVEQHWRKWWFIWWWWLRQHALFLKRVQENTRPMLLFFLSFVRFFLPECIVHFTRNDNKLIPISWDMRAIDLFFHVKLKHLLGMLLSCIELLILF